MNYQEYRNAHAADTSIEVSACACDIYPSTDGKQARYALKFNIRNISAEHEDSWIYTVPASADNVMVESARDGAGTLQTSKQPGTNGSCDIVVQYRAPVAKGGSYEFEFAFTSSMRSVCTDEIIAKTVVAFNWFVHGHFCRAQTVRVHLPKRAKLLESSPPPSEATDAIAYRAADLRPEETFTFLYAYRKFAVGAAAAAWFAGAVTTGAIGYLVGVLIGVAGLK